MSDSLPSYGSEAFNRTLEKNALALNDLSLLINTRNREVGWWPENVEDRNKGEILALVHSEVSEALEGLRKNKMDDHLPHRTSVEVELSDAIIRILDMAGAYGYDLGNALVEKFHYNQKRADHKLSNRQKDGGKKF